MDRRSRASRFAVAAPPSYFKRLEARRNPWYESPEEIAAGLAWGRRKARLLQWVRQEMATSLTQREQECIDLYFFHGMTCREVGQATGTNASSVHRAIRRSIRKLRQAARLVREHGDADAAKES